MKQIRKRLTYANVMSSMAVFLILGGASAIAAKKIGSNQLKANSVGTGKIKKNAVTTAKIKKNAITTAKIRNEAVTGAKLNESTLGTVPSATTAASLAGQTPFFIRLAIGQNQTIATNGAVSLVAVCDQTGVNDRIRIISQTSVNGAVAAGNSSFSGNGGKFLNVDTPVDTREIVGGAVAQGTTVVFSNIDAGWVLGPEGKMLSINSEGIALGLNYGNAGCLVAGIVNAVG